MRTWIGLACAAIMVLASGAFGGPRLSVTSFNEFSDAPNGHSILNSDLTSSTFPVRYISVRGTLTPLISGTYAREATIYVSPPSGAAFSMVPSNQTTFIAGTTIADTIYKLPTPLSSASGI